MPRPAAPLYPTRSSHDLFGALVRQWRTLRGLTQDALGEKAHVSGNMVAKIERAQRSCSQQVAHQLDQALEAGGVLDGIWAQLHMKKPVLYNDDVVLYNQSPTAPDSDAGRAATPILEQPGTSSSDRNAVELVLPPTAAAPVGGALGAILPSQPERHLPTVVRRQDIEQVDNAATVLTSWDHRYGGYGLVQQSADAHLRWTAGVLERKCPAELQTKLFASAARLGMVAGAIGFDAGNVEAARRDFAFATATAEEAGAWQLRAKICSFRARLSVWSGQAHDAVVHADLGLVHQGSLTGREQAMLHTARARALALSGDHAGVMDAVAAADKAFEASRGQGPPWMAYLDFAQHQGDTGHALGELALHTRDRFTAALAANRLREAVTSHADDFPRSRAFSRTLLAELTMMAEDPDEGSRIGAVAVEEVQSVRSRRAIVGLRRLAREASRHRPTAPVIHLRERIRECLA